MTPLMRLALKHVLVLSLPYLQADGGSRMEPPELKTLSWVDQGSMRSISLPFSSFPCECTSTQGSQAKKQAAAGSINHLHNFPPSAATLLRTPTHKPQTPA